MPAPSAAPSFPNIGQCGDCGAWNSLQETLAAPPCIAETAADLAVIMAALSSFRDRPVASDLIVFSEVGLAGEVRPVPNGEERLREAVKHGFKRAIVPRANAPRRGSRVEGIEVIGVTRLAEVMGTV